MKPPEREYLSDSDSHTILSLIEALEASEKRCERERVAALVEALQKIAWIAPGYCEIKTFHCSIAREALATYRGEAK